MEKGILEIVPTGEILLPVVFRLAQDPVLDELKHDFAEITAFAGCSSRANTVRARGPYRSSA
jgi:hypothetical protein